MVSAAEAAAFRYEGFPLNTCSQLAQTKGCCTQIPRATAGSAGNDGNGNDGNGVVNVCMCLIMVIMTAKER
eukprot:7436372-Pyramimonas_sp.AAC.1